MRGRWLIGVLASVLCVLTSMLGCHRNAASTVSGMITMNGTPVEMGAISFLPADGRGPTAGAKITNGRYKVLLTPGKKTVKIEGYKVIGTQPADPRDPTAPPAPLTESIVPAKYNTATTLTVDVNGSTSELDFALRS
jgi:hypothetical protein